MIVIDGFHDEITLRKRLQRTMSLNWKKALQTGSSGQVMTRKISPSDNGHWRPQIRTYGCINSHYFRSHKNRIDETKGLFRTKQAGRTGLGNRE